MVLAASGSIFDPIYNFFGAILAFFYGIIPNLGVSIILLTVLVMLVMFPLTAKQARSMMEMQRAQPEIKKLQAKYKNDRQKQNEEVMKFYQEHKINPLAGCLPLLVQMPVFFALFRVMREPYKHIPKSSDLYAAFCTGANGVLHTKDCTVGNLPKPQYFLGMDLSQHATGVTGGFLDALPYFLLVGAVIVTAFLQSRQSRRNSPNMNSQMAMVTTVLPIGFGLLSLAFPAGLVLYFLISNLWRLGQQELIMRKITGPMRAAGPIEVKGTDKTTTSKSPPEVEAGPPPPAKATGGLRKLFQPATPPTAESTGNGEGAPATDANGAKPKSSGQAKPRQGASKSTGASKSGASRAGSQRGGASGSGQRGGGNPSSAARRKKRKRR
ncbi:MAG TPA: membrane protein insertase YidC [Acidimicrobiia bacterium]|jgi:YidC/Oxa1 family membrane protein insertase